VNDGSHSTSWHVFCHRLPVWHGRRFIRPQVNTEPMTNTDPRDLIKRLADDLERITEELVIPEYAHTEKERTDASLALIDEARAYLAQPEPEGTIAEPRGCPTPGACSCPTAPYVPPDLIRALELAEAALADIGDAEREPGDGLAWAEARAAQDLPRIRAVLARWGK